MIAPEPAAGAVPLQRLVAELLVVASISARIHQSVALLAEEGANLLDVGLSPVSA